MLRSLLSRLRRRRPTRHALPARFIPGFERLESRDTPAVSALLIPQAGVLSVFGDAGNNTSAVSRNAAGRILINGGADRILGGTPTVANTRSISVFGLGGNDTITLDEANGALPAANLFGGAGNDTLSGGSGN